MTLDVHLIDSLNFPIQKSFFSKVQTGNVFVKKWQFLKRRNSSSMSKPGTTKFVQSGRVKLSIGRPFLEHTGGRILFFPAYISVRRSNSSFP